MSKNTKLILTKFYRKKYEKKDEQNKIKQKNIK